MANPDITALLDTLIPFAERMLSKHGEFLPFGAKVTADGDVTSVAAYDGEDAPQSQQLIDMMTEGIKRQALAGEIRAAAICYDVRTTPPGTSETTDAICVVLEQRTGEAVTVYVPYKKTLFGKYKLGEAFASPRTLQFFESAGDNQ